MEILSLGEKIRNRRKELKMTLKDLAGDRVTAGQLSFVELGKSNPSTELLEYIAQRLNVSVDYLLESEVSQAKSICESNIRIAQAYIYDKGDEDAEKLLNETYQMALHYDLGDLMGRIELNRGKIALHNEKYEEAMVHFLKADEYFITYRDIPEEIEAYIMLAETSNKLGSYNIAISYYRQAGALNKADEFYDDKINAKINFGVCQCYIMMGLEDKADQYLKPVEEYLESINDKREYAHKLMTVSLSYKKVKNYDKALKIADRAVILFKEAEDFECLAKIEMNMGFIYCAKGDTDKSDYYLGNCKKLLRSSDIINLSRVYLNQARNAINRDRLDDAKEYIENSLNMAIDAEDYDCQIDCYSVLYDICTADNDTKGCESALEKKLSILEALGRTEDLIECTIDTGKYYKGIGDNKKYEEYMKKGYNMLSLYNSIKKVSI